MEKPLGRVEFKKFPLDNPNGGFMSTLFMPHDFPKGVARFNIKIPLLPPDCQDLFF